MAVSHNRATAILVAHHYSVHAWSLGKLKIVGVHADVTSIHRITVQYTVYTFIQTYSTYIYTHVSVQRIRSMHSMTYVAV